MADHTIASIAKLSELVESESWDDDERTTVLYRGHGAASFELRPRVGREKPPPNSGRVTVNEQLMLELFRRQLVDRLPIAPESDWEVLAVAQHHGMATRLLDWTRSPLVALYFAVCKECESRHKEEAEIIAWRCPKVDLSKSPPPESPLEITEDLRYVPRIVTPRLRAQSGVFTAHRDPTEVFRPAEDLVRLRIPYDHRKALKHALFRHGVHEGILYPDLDGAARHIQWCQTESY